MKTPSLRCKRGCLTLRIMTRVGPTSFVKVTDDIAKYIGGSIGERHFECAGEVVKVGVDRDESCPLYGAGRLWFYHHDSRTYFVEDK